MLLQMFITRPISAITTLQKRNKVSHVMYIASPPSARGRQKKTLDFLNYKRKQPHRYGTPTDPREDHLQLYHFSK